MWANCDENKKKFLPVCYLSYIRHDSGDISYHGYIFNLDCLTRRPVPFPADDADTHDVLIKSVVYRRQLYPYPDVRARRCKNNRLRHNGNCSKELDF